MAAEGRSGALRVLFIGGTGTISASCVRLAVQQGIDVTVLNRGRSSTRTLPETVRWLEADANDAASLHAELQGTSWDAVANFVSFDADNVRQMADIFDGITDQYVHISSASIYSKPVWRYPISESSPVGPNPPLPYATAKYEAEVALRALWRERGFPMTIVRPSHTYDEGSPPMPGGWTMIERLKRGLPIPVHGDGTSLWTLTHARDFAQGFVGLLGNPRAVGDGFHITGDDVYTWDTIYRIFGRVLGVEPRLVHLTSEMVEMVAPDWFWTGEMLGDIGHSAVFDNSKIRSVVPGFRPEVSLHVGAREIVRFAEQHADVAVSDAETEAVVERLCEGYRLAEAALRGLAL